MNIRGWSAKFLLVASSVLVGLLIVEVALRAVGYTYPVFYTTDTERGYALRPHMEGWYRKEGEAYVRINSDGLRDREHTKTKPPDTLRIAVLGDSYAEALQVPLENAFWMVMEARLKGCEAAGGGRTKIEVINFGVSGYSTAQELITLRQHVWDYSPDIVLVAVTTNNDITDNSRVFKKTDEIPYFVLRDNQLALDDSFRTSKAFRLRHSALNRAGRWIRDRLRFIQALHQSHGAIKSFIASRRARRSANADAQTQKRATAENGVSDAQATDAATPNNAAAAQAEELGVDYMIYRPPADEVWRDAWAVTERLMMQMRDEVESRGARFLVVTLSNAIQVHPEPRARQEFAKRLGVDDLLYPDLRLKALGEREGFEVLNLAPSLQAYAEQHKVFLHGAGSQIGNGHWNAHGHALAGELVARRLCEVIAR
jgi:hypothetical protein